MNANSQILAILRLRFGAFRENETRNRKRKENNPKRIVTASAVPPNPQPVEPPMLSDPEEPVPALNINSEIKLVNWPTKSIGEEESAFGLPQLYGWRFVLVLASDFFSW